MRKLIAPSLLGAPVGYLQDAVDQSESADWLHLDIMDGHFVPNTTFGPHVVHGLSTGLFKDVHLMVMHPYDHIEPFVQAGAQLISFHTEVCMDIEYGKKIIKHIRSYDCQVGIAINPDTEVDDMYLKLAHEADMLLAMTVVPGFGGQGFRDDVLSKIQYLRNKFPSKDIQVDGGINDKTIVACVEAGANIFVAGSYVYQGIPAERIEILRQNIGL